MRKKIQLVQFAFLSGVYGTKKDEMYSNATYFYIWSNYFLR